MIASFEGVTIRSIAAAMPGETFDLAELADIYDKDEIDNAIEINGISKVRVAPEGVCASDLCEKAARILLEKKAQEDGGIDDIGGVVFVSQTPDYILPATSASLQDRLGIGKDSAAFDICTGCPGYVYGLFQAAMLVNSGGCDSVLVCAGDVITTHVNPLDKANLMVLGDAGSATLVEKGTGKMTFGFTTDGSGSKHLIIPAGGARYPKDENSEMVSVKEEGNMRSDEDIFMDGMELLNYAAREVPRITDALLARHGWEKSDVRLFGLHQANRIMVNYLRKIMKLPIENVPIAMKETGNTGSASIPLMLAQEGRRLADEDRLTQAVLCGFGVGLSCAAVALDLSRASIFEPVEV